jgi:hypothetical protein
MYMSTPGQGPPPASGRNNDAGQVPSPVAISIAVRAMAQLCPS